MKVLKTSHKEGKEDKKSKKHENNEELFEKQLGVVDFTKKRDKASVSYYAYKFISRFITCHTGIFSSINYSYKDDERI